MGLYQEPTPKPPKTATAVVLRFNNDDPMLGHIQALSEQHDLSPPMTVKMLLGYAFNKINEEGKVFTSKIVFESE